MQRNLPGRAVDTSQGTLGKPSKDKHGKKDGLNDPLRYHHAERAGHPQVATKSQPHVPRQALAAALALVFSPTVIGEEDSSLLRVTLGKVKHFQKH